MRKLAVVAASVVLTAVAVGLTGAGATPPSEGVARTDIARALMTSGGGVDVEPGKETTVHHVTIPAGGSTGWHSHHDGGMFMVMSGTLTNYGLDGPACDPVVVEAGSAYFVPPGAHHPHLGLNKGAEALEPTAVYFNVPPGEPSRIDEEAPEECPAELR